MAIRTPVPVSGSQMVELLPAPTDSIRGRSIAWPLIGVLVLVSGWTIGVSYYFQQQASKNLFLAEQDAKAARAARLIESAVQLDYANIKVAARALATRSDLALALSRSNDTDAVRDWAQSAKKQVGAGMVELYDRRGTLQFRTGDLAASRAPDRSDPITVHDALSGHDSINVLRRLDGLTIRAVAPVNIRDHIVGAVAIEKAINADYLNDLTNRLGVEAGLIDDRRMLVSTLAPEDENWLEKARPKLALGKTAHLHLDGNRDMALRPLSISGEPLAVVVMVPNREAYEALTDTGRAFSIVVLLTLIVAVAAGMYLSRYLIGPVKALTARAEQLSLRYAGRAAKRSGDELDSLVASFDAMTDALLSHSERLVRAHNNELDHSLELQRQYALMRLLRGLAAAANESGTVEGTLERALHEIGDYLDWPLGRVAMLPDGVRQRGMAPRSLWYTRDSSRYAEFVSLSNGLPITPSNNHLIGRAYLSGTPHWVSDLSRMSDWNRLDAALDAGLHTGVVIPVTAHGHVAAFIEFFSDHRVEATHELLELIEAIGAELSRVAERQRAERELRQRELEASRLAMVASRTEQMVQILDTLGRVEWVNDAFLLATGHSFDQVRGRVAPGLLSGPETDQTMISHVADCIRQGEPCKVEFVAYTRAGEKRVLDMEGQPLRDDSGRYFQYALISPDITEQKRVEAALRESAEYFRALFDESPVPAVIQGADFKVIRANLAQARFLGSSVEEIVGTDTLQWMHPEEVADALAQRKPLRNRATPPLAFERRFLHKDGSVVWARGHIARFAGASGESFALTVLENVTESKASERALREAKDLAESASRAKSQFLANMSHEIRTPMNGVLGMTELLLGTPLSDKQRRFADAVYRSGESLLDIINDILDFSKIEAGRLELEELDFNLRTVVDDVFELLAPRAHQKRIELVSRIQPEVPSVVKGDPTRLRQVLTNLVGNAIKFTERGAVIVNVTAERADENTLFKGDGSHGFRILFEVRDTGIGMRPEALSKLFSVFMQADQSMSRRYGGTGLGLAISKQLVELMGGAISAESQFGEGSTFRFELALAGGDPSAVMSPVRPGQLRGKRVLLVEDNPTNRDILELQLKGFELEVATAADGATALELLRAAVRAGTPFDAAVIDMKMPVMDGLALATSIRGDPDLASTRMIMLTSLAAGNEAKLAYDSGVEVYLSKPVRQVELLMALASVLTPPAKVVDAPLSERAAHVANVLLVEDNAVNQEVARVMLADSGCAIELAGNGREALAALRKTRFDLVFMDCQMPEMDGFEALRRLRRSSAEGYATTANVPVIALTANALSGDAERCIASGFNDYLSKPFKQQQLSELVEKWAPRPAEPEEATPTRVHRLRARSAAADTIEPLAASAPAVRMNSNVLDSEVIDRIREMERRGAAQLFSRLVQTYLNTAAKLVSEAESALGRSDPVGLRQAAHTLKSSSANLGAAHLSERCATLELHARGHRLGAAREEWAHARDEYERVVQALQAMVAKGEDAGVAT